jgi:hypothetical protein
MSRIATAALVTFLAGCAAPGGVQVYEGPPRARSEVAILKGGTRDYWQAAFFHVALTATRNAPSVCKARDSCPTQVSILPGHYVIGLRCTRGISRGQTSMTLDARPGMTYEIGCQASPSVADTLSAYVVPSLSSDDD